MKLAVTALIKRIKEVERRRKTGSGLAFFELGECPELVAQAHSAHLLIHTGVPRRDVPGPRAEFCTAESLRKAMPEVKTMLASSLKSGPSDHARATAAHWASLLERFGIEDMATTFCDFMTLASRN